MQEAHCGAPRILKGVLSQEHSMAFVMEFHVHGVKLALFRVHGHQSSSTAWSTKMSPVDNLKGGANCLVLRCKPQH